LRPQRRAVETEGDNESDNTPRGSVVRACSYGDLTTNLLVETATR
jgi:hypothetical protein